jgi:hypothetical protein
MAQSVLDEGLLSMLMHSAKQLLSGSVMFFAFRMQTTCQFFSSGIVHGGATYIGTGRGFAYRPTSFTQLYNLYGRTHLLPGAELLALLSAIGLLISFQGYGIAEYAAITWPLWIHAVSLLVAPFWFGPESFAWAKVRADWAAWARWQLSGEVDATVGASWNTWNRLAGLLGGGWQFNWSSSSCLITMM